MSNSVADAVVETACDAIRLVYRDILQLQAVLRADPSELLIERGPYASHLLKRLREHGFMARIAFSPELRDRFSALHVDPVEFHGMSSSSYAWLVLDLLHSSICVVESFRAGHAETKMTLFSPNGHYHFTNEEAEELRA